MLALSPSYSKEGGELSKNSPLWHNIFFCHRLEINVKKRVDVSYSPDDESYDFCLVPAQYFGDFFRCYISCNIVILKSSASHGRWDKKWALFIWFWQSPGSPSCVRMAPGYSGRCGPLISNHRGRHERSLWRHERYHPQLLCYVPSAPGPWHGNRISLVPFHEILVSSGIWMLFICFDFWFLGISLHLFIFLTDACLFVCKM